MLGSCSLWVLKRTRLPVSALLHFSGRAPSMDLWAEVRHGGDQERKTDRGFADCAWPTLPPRTHPLRLLLSELFAPGSISLSVQGEVRFFAWRLNRVAATAPGAKPMIAHRPRGIFAHSVCPESTKLATRRQSTACAHTRGPLSSVHEL